MGNLARLMAAFTILLFSCGEVVVDKRRVLENKNSGTQNIEPKNTSIDLSHLEAGTAEMLKRYLMPTDHLGPHSVELNAALKGELAFVEFYELPGIHDPVEKLFAVERITLLNSKKKNIRELSKDVDARFVFLPWLNEQKIDYSQPLLLRLGGSVSLVPSDELKDVATVSPLIVEGFLPAEKYVEAKEKLPTASSLGLTLCFDQAKAEDQSLCLPSSLALGPNQVGLSLNGEPEPKDKDSLAYLCLANDQGDTDLCQGGKLDTSPSIGKDCEVTWSENCRVDSPEICPENAVCPDAKGEVFSSFTTCPYAKQNQLKLADDKKVSSSLAVSQAVSPSGVCSECQKQKQCGNNPFALCTPKRVEQAAPTPSPCRPNEKCASGSSNPVVTNNPPPQTNSNPVANPRPNCITCNRSSGAGVAPRTLDSTNTARNEAGENLYSNLGSGGNPPSNPRASTSSGSNPSNSGLSSADMVQAAMEKVGSTKSAAPLGSQMGPLAAYQGYNFDVNTGKILGPNKMLWYCVSFGYDVDPAIACPKNYAEQRDALVAKGLIINADFVGAFTGWGPNGTRHYGRAYAPASQENQRTPCPDGGYYCAPLPESDETCSI